MSKSLSFWAPSLQMLNLLKRNERVSNVTKQPLFFITPEQVLNSTERVPGIIKSG